MEARALSTNKCSSSRPRGKLSSTTDFHARDLDTYSTVLAVETVYMRLAKTLQLKHGLREIARFV